MWSEGGYGLTTFHQDSFPLPNSPKISIANLRTIFDLFLLDPRCHEDIDDDILA